MVRRRAAASRRRSARLRNYFLTGLILVGPLYITHQSDLVVRQLGRRRWCGRSSRSAYRPETYLPFKVPGFGLIIAFVRADPARLPDRQPGRAHAGRVRREPAQPHADRAADLQDLKQIFETLFSKSGSSFRKVGAGRISGAGHVVAGVPVAAAERRYRGAAAGPASYVSVLPAVHAEPDHRLLLLRAAQRVIELDITVEAGDDADHVGRHGAARTATQQKKLAALRARRPRAARHRAATAPAK